MHSKQRHELNVKNTGLSDSDNQWNNVVKNTYTEINFLKYLKQPNIYSNQKQREN